MSKVSDGRLKWLCRRGTKELDTLYGWWLTERAPQADDTQRQAFAELLEQQDPDLWDWTLGHVAIPREDWAAIIDEIRTHHRL
ncbi:succinate dehydrogenase assembly factor 2 [Oleiagrimonas sp. C23AA]|uniref:FAD assembly factor SdhE n=1 Tax=Oleiagrimonas sp. C23AA TaxID=2719047 RepID=UPI0031B71DEF